MNPRFCYTALSASNINKRNLKRHAVIILYRFFVNFQSKKP